MQYFEQYDPRSPQEGYHLLHFFRKPQGEDGDDFYFIKKNGYLLVYEERLHIFPSTSQRAGETEHQADQFEIPLSGIRWFTDVIEKKFFKPPEQGGLPAHKLSYKETVSGEDLHVMRSMRGGTGAAGYVITNSSRRSHLSDENLKPEHLTPYDYQSLSVSDTWLFENGLMDYLKELADLYEQGKL